MKEQLLKKVKQLELQQKEVEQSKEGLKTQINALEREIESYKRMTEVEKKNFEDLMRERDILNKNLVKASSAKQKQGNTFFIESHLANLFKMI
jgi:chromosome segregation ATPase